jgi:hypothetical protein
MDVRCVCRACGMVALVPAIDQHGTNYNITPPHGWITAGVDQTVDQPLTVNGLCPGCLSPPVIRRLPASGDENLIWTPPEPVATKLQYVTDNVTKPGHKHSFCFAPKLKICFGMETMDTSSIGDVVFIISARIKFVQSQWPSTYPYYGGVNDPYSAGNIYAELDQAVTWPRK